MKNLPLTVVRPGEMIDSIWMKVDEDKVEIDRNLLEKEFG